jgi:Mn2+/Fe2+ NRAMP family transporter
VVGTVGTTIAPWMQFYMQSAVIEKGLTMKDYRYEKWDVIIGSLATVVVAFFIVVACGATLYPNGVVIEQAKDAAMALKPFAGAFASVVFALGLFVASLFSATILPIATAFYICEAFGFEAGVNKRWREAPEFYLLFTAIMVIGIVIILLPNAPLITITLWTQILNGILLPLVLIYMLRLVNNRQIMGKHVNTPLQNWITYATVFLLVGMTGLIVVLSFIR